MKSKEKKKVVKPKDFTTNALIFQVLVSNPDDIICLFRTAKELNFTNKYKITTEFDPAKGVAYFSNEFTNDTKAEMRELLSVCATALLNQANIPGSIVEETF